MPSDRRLLARDLDAERSAHRVAGRTVPTDVGSVEEALQRCRADLAVDCAMVFLLDPGVSRTVQELERQALLPLQHRHESSLNASPEVSCLPF